MPTAKENKAFYIHKATGRNVDAPKVSPKSWVLIRTTGKIREQLIQGAYSLCVWKRKQIGGKGMSIEPM